MNSFSQRAMEAAAAGDWWFIASAPSANAGEPVVVTTVGEAQEATTTPPMLDSMADPETLRCTMSSKTNRKKSPWWPFTWAERSSK
jgi:hypothetical protein